MGGALGGSYWVLEVVLVLVSLAVGIAGTSLYYRLQKKELPPTRETPCTKVEPVAEAYEELRGLVEDHIVNRQDFTAGLILNLMAAIERRHGVILSDTHTPTSILQDVLLSLQRSRHLDIAQKGKFAARLEERIVAFQQAAENAAKQEAAKSRTRRSRTARARRKQEAPQPSSPPEAAASNSEGAGASSQEDSAQPQE